MGKACLVLSAFRGYGVALVAAGDRSGVIVDDRVGIPTNRPGETCVAARMMKLRLWSRARLKQRIISNWLYSAQAV